MPAILKLLDDIKDIRNIKNRIKDVELKNHHKATRIKKYNKANRGQINKSIVQTFEGKSCEIMANPRGKRFLNPCKGLNI